MNGKWHEGQTKVKYTMVGVVMGANRRVLTEKWATGEEGVHLLG